MLKSVHARNFRKLTDSFVEFGEGLQVVRGNNEAGKSTMLEAIAYALAGAKALRGDMASIVPWDAPKAKPSVTLVMECDGVEYTITRSKAGAEVNYGEGSKVVGQNEVSAFVANLIGANVDTMGRLMVAPQGAIRGALSQGPKATMELIEDLADFGIIDRVLELIAAKLVTGPTQLAEDRLTRASVAHTEAQAAVVTVDTAAMQGQLAGYDAAIATRRDALAGEWEPKFKQSEAAVRAAQQAKALRDSLNAQWASVVENKKVHLQQRSDALQAASVVVDANRIANLRGEINNAAQHVGVRAAWDALQKLQAAYPEEFWEGSFAGFEEELNAARTTVSTQTNLITKLDGDIRVLRSQMVADGTCGACGKDISKVPEVLAKNAELLRQIDGKSSDKASAEKYLAAARESLKACESVLAAAKPYEALYVRYPELIRLEDTDVPCRLFWKGTAPGAAPDVAAMKAELQALEAAQAAVTKAKARVEALDATLIEDGQRIESLTAQVEACNAADDLPVLREAHELVAAQYNLRVNDITEFKYLQDKLARDIVNVGEMYERQMHEVAKAEKAAELAEADLKSQRFNNDLVKRVRLARPIIADKLWAIVLSAVSTYFSSMRGTQSVVARAANSFQVDGQPIDGLSGSTLDILGLAIRLALTRTFLPAAPFLILDEPAAACDEDRENAMMGFLLATGFKQTLLVTHSDVEAVASNLITL